MTTSLTQQLDDALERYSSGAVPDYASFKFWVRQNNHHYKSPFLPSADMRADDSIDMLILQKYKDLENQLDANTITPGDWSKWKLLHSYLDGNGKRSLLSTLEISTPYKDVLSAKEISNLNRSEAKAFFFMALEKNNERLAGRLISEILRKEEFLDCGEIEYLESLYYYRSREFEQSAEFARQTTEADIDYRNTSFILLDSLIKIGDIGEFIKVLKSRHELLDANSRELLRQNLVLHIGNATCSASNQNLEQCADEAFSLLLGSNKSITLDTELSSFQELKINISRIRLDFIRRYRDVLVRNDIAHKTFAKLWENDQTQALELLSKHDPNLVALAASQSFFPDFSKFFIKQDYYNLIVSALSANGQEIQSFNEISIYSQLLEELDRHNERYSFLSGGYNYFSASFDKNESLKLLIDALQSAVSIQNEEGMELCTSRLRELGMTDDQIAGSVEHAADTATLGRLSQKAQRVYSSAYWVLGKAEEDGYRWRDAGSISLGFMKTIEIELNDIVMHRFISRGFIEQMRTACKRAPKERKRNELKTVEIFEKSLLRKHNPSLGAYSRFFDVLKAIRDRGDNSMRTTLNDLLTERGLQALYNGDLSKGIEPKVLGRYRNPPAHTELLDLVTAKEAKAHVDNMLSNHLDWFCAHELH